MKFSRALHGFVLLVLLFCLMGCQTTAPLNLPSWNRFDQEVRNDYSCINRIRTKQSNHDLSVFCYCGKVSEQEKAELKTKFKAFLSSDDFLKEFLPFADERGLIFEDAAGEVFYPRIYIDIAADGSDASEWQSEAGYYSTRQASVPGTTIDNYQTWNDHNRQA